ncbi:NAD(P)-dependent oxidoreductase [Candidatus Uhrbacteria bacterium]|nr:NAD(P)-dependent oxidoreductase [Candidatus Uhrbacteria bacterium]
MKILVTGGAGYMGSVLTRLLLTSGQEVRVLDSLLYGGRSLLGLYHEEGFHFVRGDIRSASVAEQALDGVAVVVHLAAVVGDPACARQPKLAQEINQDASLQLFDLCQREGVQRFVYASTCSNYGRMTDTTDYLNEDSVLRPVSLYAETKVAVERALLKSSTSSGPTVSVLRFATLFGLSPRMRFDLTVNEFTMELITKRKVTVYGKQFWRPYIHVLDAARAIALVLNSPAGKVDGQAFNVGETTQNYQKAQLVDLIRAQIGHQNQVDYVQKTEDPRDYRVSFEKIKQELGFRITRTVDTGVREIADAISQGLITDLDNPTYRN